MKVITVILLVVASAAVWAAPSNKAVGPEAVCYYGSWATYRPWPGAYHVSDIDASLCTHLVYAFAGLDASSLDVISLDPYNDLEEDWGKGSFKKFAAIAQKNPHVTTYLAVGGWNEGSRKYSDMAATSAGRKRFATRAADFVEKYGFGGLDLDWEYPTQREGRPQDKENFVLLLKELKSVLSARDLSLTVAVGADPAMLGVAYDAAGIAENVDLINLMAFDFYTADSSNITAPNAPLTSSVGLYSVEESVQQWLDAGVPPEKLVVGVPLYSRTYTLADPSETGVSAPATGPGAAGPVTQEPGYLTYYELCMKIEDEGWQKGEQDGVFYAFHEDQWATYEPLEEVRKKAEFAVKKGLAGVMVWPLESDDVADVCDQGKSPLLKELNKGLGRL